MPAIMGKHDEITAMANRYVVPVALGSALPAPIHRSLSCTRCTPLAVGVWFWLAVLVCFWLIAAMAGMPEAETTGSEASGRRMLSETEQPEAVREVMTVNVATEDAKGVRVFRGRLKQPGASAHERLRRTLGGQSVPLLQQDDEMDAALVLMPRSGGGQRIGQPIRPWVHWLLFGLTVVTTTWAGAAPIKA